ncbi:hypothetical protein ACFOHM_21235 [Microbaculum marinum]|uniref:DUF1127 domain-containing protein n=1 Tax=Microbaculum marinum TaxID=1764581 RepID=A0AAW9RTN1_9HYPH
MTTTNTLSGCAASPRRGGLLNQLALLAAALRQDFRRRLADRERHRAFRNLADLDDRTLEDIGLRRTHIGAAANLPLEINSSLAIRQMAADRRAAGQRMRRR